MPHLTGPEEVGLHLAAAIANGDHYVFAADCEPARACVRRFAVAATVLCGTPADAMVYVDLTFLVGATGRTTRVGVLTVRKAALPAGMVAAFLALLGSPQPPTAETDLFPIGTDPLYLAAVLDTIRRGEAYPVTPGAN